MQVEEGFQLAMKRQTYLAKQSHSLCLLPQHSQASTKKDITNSAPVSSAPGWVLMGHCTTKPSTLKSLCLLQYHSGLASLLFSSLGLLQLLSFPLLVKITMLRVLAMTYFLHCLTRGPRLPSFNFEGLGSSLKCKHLKRPSLQLKPIHAGSDQNPLYRFHWSPTPHQHPSLTWYAMPILSSDENKQASIMVSPDSSLSLDPPSVLCSTEGQRASSKASV